jgi:DNA polymerase III delta subunit
VYLLQGRNHFLIETKVSELVKGEIIRLGAASTESDLMSALYQEGFDDVERTVIVWGTEAVSALGKKSVADLLKGIEPHVRLIVVFDDNPNNAPKNNSLIAAVKKHGQTFVYKPLYDDEALVNWIVHRGEELGVIMDQPTADVLFRLLGTMDQNHIDNELRKLATAVIDSGVLTIPAVQRFCSHLGEDEVFNFCQQVGFRRLGPAFQLWRLLDKRTGNAVLTIKGALRSHLLKLLTCIDHCGLSDEELSEMIGTRYVFLFQRAGWRQQAQQWGRLEVMAVLRYLNDIPVQESKRQLELHLRRFMLQYLR